MLCAGRPFPGSFGASCIFFTFVLRTHISFDFWKQLQVGWDQRFQASHHTWWFCAQSRTLSEGSSAGAARLRRQLAGDPARAELRGAHPGFCVPPSPLRPPLPMASAWAPPPHTPGFQRLAEQRGWWVVSAGWISPDCPRRPGVYVAHGTTLVWGWGGSRRCPGTACGKFSQCIRQQRFLRKVKLAAAFSVISLGGHGGRDS